MTAILAPMGYSIGIKGQVVIPKEIRDALHIVPGQEMVFERRGDEIIVRKAKGVPLKGRFAGLGLTSDLEKSRADERARDARRS